MQHNYTNALKHTYVRKNTSSNIKAWNKFKKIVKFKLYTLTKSNVHFNTVGMFEI